MKEPSFASIALVTLAIGIAAILICAAIVLQLDEDWITFLDHVGILLGLVLGGLGAGAGILALAQKARLRMFLQRFGSRPDYANVRAATEGLRTDFQAVVLPVSNREVPEWILTHLRPKVAALLYTQQSEATALDLLRKFGDQVDFVVSAADIEQVHGLRLDNPNDIEDSRRMVEHFLTTIQKRGIEPRHIVVDTTGGKVPMSLGAFQAAEQAGAASMYVVGKQFRDGRPGFITNPEDIAAGEVVMMNRPG